MDSCRVLQVAQVIYLRGQQRLPCSQGLLTSIVGEEKGKLLEESLIQFLGGLSIFMFVSFFQLQERENVENGKTPTIFHFLLFCLQKKSFMPNPSSLTFQKRLSLKMSYYSRLNSLCCPVSVPYSLHLPPQLRQQGKKQGFFSPLQQHKVQSIYRKIGAVVFSSRTQ